MTNIVYLPKHVKLDPIQIIKEKKLTGIFIPKSNLEIIVDPFEFPSNLDDNFTFNHEIESTDEQLNHTRKVPKLSEKYKSQNHDSPIVSKAGTRVHINPQTDELTESLDSKIESKPSKRSAPRARATTATDISSSKKPLEIRKRTQRISTINSAFGYPIPTIKRLDLDYSDNLWYILNERGIY
ncbi:hypothetical protein BC833DRAFT_625650 [Globomyces pollinis-pini]|nr:hypothetical protein BC833DRAFT_625650 [Globomyces pollinis-pini]